ncbi:hypothetical protein JMUB7524_27240 [Staphylococcus aureus]
MCIRDSTNFEVDYKKYVQDVNQHQELSKEIEDKLMQLSQRKLIEQNNCLLYTSPSPRDMRRSRMPSSA